MQHHVIVKFNDTVKDKIALANEIGNLFKGMHGREESSDTYLAQRFQ